MERIERLARTWIASESDAAIEDTVSEISAGNATLLQIVQALGEYLTSEEDDLRAKGVEFLSLVIGRCPAEKLNRQAVRVLVTFYCGKLDDTETIIPSLKGLVSLTMHPAFASSDAVEVMKALFAHVKMKVLIQSQRFMVFSIVDNIMAKHRDALKGTGADFVRGYISLAEGEKDPRNLIVAFAIARVLIVEFEVSVFIEDIFNITFCYFPITFRPPPNDPYGISADDLKAALRTCLQATPAFGPLAVPLFIEKLIAGSPVTKRETLETLAVCLPVYGAGTAKNHARKLWNSLKLEIFQPTDSATEEKALKTTQVLVQTIYAGSNADDSGSADIDGLAKDACKECIQILQEPEKSQAKPAMKVLCAFLSTTGSVAKFTLKEAVPHLVKLFHNPDEIANRAPTLRLLSDLIASCRASASQDPEVLPDDGDLLLSPYKDDLLGVFTVGLKAPSSASPALDSLGEMVNMRGLLSDEELGFIVHNVNEILQADDDASEPNDAALDLLSAVSSISPSHVSENTLPLLFRALPDTAPARDAESERIKYWRTLASLKKLCKEPNLFETLVVRLSTKLDLLCGASEPEGDSEPTAAYAHSILRTIADVLSLKVGLGHADVVKYIDRLVPRLYNLFIYSALVVDGGLSVTKDPRLLAVAAETITLITQTLNAARQTAFVKDVMAAFVYGNVTQLANGQQKIPSDKKFLPFEPNAPSEQKNLVLLFSAAFISIRQEVTLPNDEVSFVTTLLDWIRVEAENQSQRQAVMHLLAALLNKHAPTLATPLSGKLESLWTSEVCDQSLSADSRRNAIATWTWVTKALLIRGHPNAMSYVNSLFELFGDPDVGWDAARSIGKVVGTDNVLTKNNHAIIKFLHAQRYCNAVLPRIVEGAKSSSDGRQQNAFLVALTSLINSVPRSVYGHEMSTLMPLLLRGLDLPDNDIRASVMDTLLTAAKSGSETEENRIVSEHAASLVSGMLRNSQVSQMPSVRVRVAALRYLAILPSIVRYDILHPQKVTVIRELAKALDDPRRAVRQEAVEARTNWFKFSG